MRNIKIFKKKMSSSASRILSVGTSKILRSRNTSVPCVYNSTNSIARSLHSRSAFRGFGSGKGITAKRPRLKNSSNDVGDVWYTTRKPIPSSLDMGHYGLKRLDYNNLVPPVWTLPPQPPTKRMAEKIAFPLTILAVIGIGFWVYLNPEEDDMTEYWKRVETGQILVDDDDDDEDDEDEEED